MNRQIDREMENKQKNGKIERWKNTVRWEDRKIERQVDS
jgi:hypothetical protein